MKRDKRVKNYTHVQSQTNIITTYKYKGIVFLMAVPHAKHLTMKHIAKTMPYQKKESNE